MQDVSLEVHRGEIVALIGANGAGKSTVLNTLSGRVRARAGRVEFAGLDLLAAAPQTIVRAGLVQVPEGREILAGCRWRTTSASERGPAPIGPGREPISRR